MKVAKAIFTSVIIICLFSAVYASCSFDGDSITLNNAIILLCVSAIVGGLSFIGRLIVEKIIEDRKDWQSLY